MRLTGMQWVYLVSLLFHGGLALFVSGIDVEREIIESFEVTMAEQEAPKPEEPPPPPPEPPPPEVVQERPRPRPRAAEPPPPVEEAPPPEEAPAETGPAPPSFGLELGNLGGPGGPGGIAVPVGDPNAAIRPPAPVRRVARVVPPTPPEQSRRPTPEETECAEELVRPRPVGAFPQPQYPEEARAQGLGGRVRVSITIDESGNVVEASIVESPSPLFEASALEAARAARFEPATRCGRAVRHTVTIALRFNP